MTSAYENNMVGYQAGYNLTTGRHNNFIGYQAGLNCDEGANNSFIGYHAGRETTSGEQNIGFGTGSLIVNTTGSRNTVLGYDAGYHNTTQNHNMFLGFRSGYRVTGSNNVLLTPEGGDNDETNVGIDNVFSVYRDNEIKNSAGTPLLYGIISADSSKILCVNTRNTGLSTLNSSATKLLVNGNVRAGGYGSFTGIHDITLDNTVNSNTLEPGMILSTTGVVNKVSLLDVKAEVNLSSTQNDKKVYGVFSNSEVLQNYDNETETTTSTTIHRLAALGEGQVLVTDINGNIENGDYITTSDIAGYGMKQSDDLLHNYTLGKCLETVDWSTITDTITHNSVVYKKYLISCTYHSG